MRILILIVDNERSLRARSSICRGRLRGLRRLPGNALITDQPSAPRLER
ncbi:MAG TPA: hypothetical protein VGQ36_16355 [Thermoanaerobaculia bacterium]|jgi:hypothetical protein|nr:hypothetical protein [Thermoanaerobaculia bacterium]